jgi:hypothetical protein
LCSSISAKCIDDTTSTSSTIICLLRGQSVEAYSAVACDAIVVTTRYYVVYKVVASSRKKRRLPNLMNDVDEERRIVSN